MMIDQRRFAKRLKSNHMKIFDQGRFVRGLRYNHAKTIAQEKRGK